MSETAQALQPYGGNDGPEWLCVTCIKHGLGDVPGEHAGHNTWVMAKAQPKKTPCREHKGFIEDCGCQQEHETLAAFAQREHPENAASILGRLRSRP